MLAGGSFHTGCFHESPAHNGSRTHPYTAVLDDYRSVGLLLPFLLLLFPTGRLLSRRALSLIIERADKALELAGPSPS